MNENDVYKHSIDETLRLLGSCEPPAGYLDRLHRRIETAQELHSIRGSVRLWIPAACVAAAAILIAVLLPGFLHPSKPAEIAVFTASNTAQRSKKSRERIPQRLKPHFVAAISDPSASLRAGSLKPVPFKTGPSQRHAKRHRGATTRDAANLFNYPLTHQERLLLRFARTAKPADLQTLNPEYQARLEAQQEAEFAAYLQSGNVSENSSSYSTASKNSRPNQTTQE